MNTVWCVIPAAGSGTRAGLGMNKAFYPIRGRMMLLRTMDAIADAGCADGLVVVLNESERQAFEDVLRKETPGLPVLFANGGNTRQQSVLNGLKALPEDCGYVLIHDAARPFVAAGTVREALRCAREYGSGIPCARVTDTVKMICDDGRIVTPDRDALRSVQTPQAFRTSDILECHLRAQREGFTGTDDASLYERYRGTVHLFDDPCSGVNRKMTMKSDFVEDEYRTGHGYDAHRLAGGRKLVLGGVEIPYERGLLGHSDADAALHALADAILGAAGEDDIGCLFPDKDPAYKDISSLVLLERVCERIREKGFAVVNADITIIAQKPKIRPYIPEMKQRISAVLGTEHVNVKGTTTEGMGFEGEEKGISAHAAVLLKRI